MISLKQHGTNYVSFYRLLIVLVAWVSVGGCINTVTVEKFTGKEKGFRYALPKPYILVTPRSDGGIDVQSIMLPDSNNEYVIRTTSILSSYKQDLVFEQGLLKSVTGKQDTITLAAQLATNTGAVLKSRIDAQITADAEVTKKRADAAKVVHDAELEYHQAVAELKYLQKAREDYIAGKPGRVEVKDSQIIDAQVKVLRAEQKLQALTSTASGSFNIPEATGGKPAQGGVWGPMLFAIIESADEGNPTVKLKAVYDQESFKTITLPTPDDKNRNDPPPISQTPP